MIITGQTASRVCRSLNSQASEEFVKSTPSGNFLSAGLHPPHHFAGAVSTPPPHPFVVVAMSDMSAMQTAARRWSDRIASRHSTDLTSQAITQDTPDVEAAEDSELDQSEVRDQSTDNASRQSRGSSKSRKRKGRSSEMMKPATKRARASSSTPEAPRSRRKTSAPESSSVRNADRSLRILSRRTGFSMIALLDDPPARIKSSVTGLYHAVSMSSATEEHTPSTSAGAVNEAKPTFEADEGFSSELSDVDEDVLRDVPAGIHIPQAPSSAPLPTAPESPSPARERRSRQASRRLSDLEHLSDFELQSRILEVKSKIREAENKFDEPAAAEEPDGGEEIMTEDTTSMQQPTPPNSQDLDSSLPKDVPTPQTSAPAEHALPSAAPAKRPRGRPRKVQKKERLIVKLSVPPSALASLIAPQQEASTNVSQRDGMTTPISSTPISDGELPVAPLLPSPASTNLPGRPISPDSKSSAAPPDYEQMKALSRKMTYREPIKAKPLPSGQPRVWADSRQALCETVPYFNMPQSGCHQNDRHVYGFLSDGTGSCREYVDTDVIIVRSGGGMATDKSGALVQSANQKMNGPQVQAVLNDVKHQSPLVVVCGDKNGNAVCKMPHRYNVLGWWKPVLVWAEKTLGLRGKSFDVIKYRFERLDPNEPAWHAPGGISGLTPDERKSVGPLLRLTCMGCGQAHPQIYLEGWMCLTAGCAQFWKFEDGREGPLDTGDLTYNPAFLLDRTRWEDESPPYDEKPTVPQVGNRVGDNLTRINTRGLCCPRCGRCSQRRHFRGWTCDNVDCDYVDFPPHLPVTIPALHNPFSIVGEGPSLAQNKYEDGVDLAVSYKHGFKVFTYTFVGIEGKLVHAVSNARINREPGGADDMFMDMQKPESDLNLERRQFKVERNSGVKLKAPSRGRRSSKFQEPSFEDGDDQHHHDDEEDAPVAREKGDLMTAFSINYGWPYKFLKSVASLPFDGAPWMVGASRADLNWASQNLLDPKDHTDLNEELILAYMEGQDIKYHDDGESGLGPRIATLSLGGKAKMKMRMKAKHFTGISDSNLLTEDRPVPGGIGGKEMDIKRLAAWEKLQELKDTDRAKYSLRRKEIPSEIGLAQIKKKNPRDLLTITLNHGDIVLMEGYEIQKYLEHAVAPEQCLRFALTCRTIKEEHLQPDERPKYVVGPDRPELSALRRMAERLAREKEKKE